MPPDAKQGKKEVGSKEIRSLRQGEKQMVGMMMRQSQRKPAQPCEPQAVVSMPGDLPVILATQGQTPNDAAQMKGNKDHEFGPPGIWALGGALRCFNNAEPDLPGAGLSINVTS